jgi:CHAT domain-containing protein/tetratricopeptide (TPR) repeat protein
MSAFFDRFRSPQSVADADSVAQAKARFQRGAQLYLDYVRSPAAYKIPFLQEAIQCYTDALRVITERHHPADWATIQNNLGTAYRNLPAGDKRQNISRAIECYQAALRTYATLNLADLWASTQYNLGNAYREMPANEWEETTLKAIACYQVALQVRTEETHPVEWARTQHSLGTAYANLTSGDQKENLRKAIGCYEAALRFFTERNSPSEWAMLQMSLGGAYANLLSRDRQENADRAIDYYVAALRIFDEQRFPVQWAMAQDNLGTAIGKSSAGTRNENLQRAVDCHLAALRVFTESEFPQDWARTQANLAAAYLALPTDTAENSQKAMDCYNAALRVYTEQDFPQDWARTQIALGSAYGKLTGGGRKAGLEKALDCYQAALRVCSERASPQYWAMVQDGLGDTYYRLRAYGRERNLESALHHYQAALRVYTEQDFPEAWGKVERRMGNLFADSPANDPGGNLRKAVECFQQALKVFTEEASPEEWAETQTDLGNALDQMRIPEVGNFETAINCFQAALRVFTKADFPVGWARTLTSLGGAYTRLDNGDRNHHFDMALDYYRQAAEVFTKEAYPLDWAIVQSNTANVYAEMRRGDQQDNLSRAIHHYQMALQVMTETDSPIYWATTQHNLACVYLDLPGADDTNLEAAITCFQAALRVHTQQAFPEDWARIQNSLGNAYRRLPSDDARIDLAPDHYHAALQVYTELHFPWYWGMAQNNLGAWYMTTNSGDRAENLRKAIAHFQAALRVHGEEDSPTEWARAHSNLGGVFVDMRAIDPSLDLQPAIESFRAALRVLTADAMPFDCLNTLHNLCTAYFRERQWREALGTCDEIIHLLESQRAAALTTGERYRLFAEKAVVFARAMACCIGMDRYADALVYTERGKTRNLVESLVRRDVMPQGIAESEWLKYLNLLVEMQGLERRLKSRNLRDPVTAAEYRDIHDELARSRATLQEIEGQFRACDPDYLPTALPLTIADIQTIVRQTEAVLVEFSVTEIGTFVFLLSGDDADVTQAQVIAAPEFTSTVLNELLVKKNADGQLSDGWLAKYYQWRRQQITSQEWMDCLEQTAGRLQTELLHLIRERLKTLYPEAKRLIFVPNKGLNLLPLHAAYAETNGQRRYWLDEYEIFYAPSCAVLYRCLERDQQRQAREVLFAVQNPIHSGERPLSFADWDVEEAAQYFPVKHILHGAEATLAQVKRFIAEGHEVLLSCHGTYNLKDVMTSHLALHGSDELLMGDILDLDLSKAWLVVLSACETAVTDYRDLVDEAEGLHTAFLIARAPTVVGSLWSVSDLSTALLMKRFHENLYKHHLGKASALREAQCWLRDLPLVEAQGLLDEKQAQLKRVSAQDRVAAIEVAAARSDLEELAAAHGGKPFSHIHWWAAFQCVGAG